MSIRNRFPFTAVYRFVERRLLPCIEPHFQDPNTLSWMGVWLAVGVPFGFWLHPFWGMVGLILSGLADILDGLMAKSHRQVTPFGAFLDSSLDRISDFFYLLGFWVLWVGRPAMTLVSISFLLGILGTFLISYVKARAQSLTVACDTGWMERGLRTVYLILWALLLTAWPGRTDLIMWGGLYAYVGLVWWTVVQRFLHVRRLMQTPRTS